MKLFSILAFTFIFILNSVVAAPQSPPVLPENDDFYKAPEGFEDAELGSVLKFRKTPRPLRSVFLEMNVKNSYQLLVRSEDSHGNPNAIVTTIIEPYNADNSKVVSYQIAEDSSASHCSPSYSIQYGASWDTVVAQAEMLILQLALNQGWWAVVPDYEGPKSVFTAGRQAGQAVLNSLRAAMNSVNRTGISPDAEYVMWGYSGGTIATGWASALQPTYAPELKDKILGAAVGGFVTNITLTILATDGTAYAGLVPNGMVGLSTEFPELQPIIESYMTDKYYDTYKYNGVQCLARSILYTAYAHMFQGTNPWFPARYDLLSEPTVKATILKNTLAVNETEVPEIPMFVYHGVDDNIVPSSNTVRAYKNWCASGIPSLEVSYSESTRHITEMVLGSPAAFTWLKARFDHKPTVDGCKQTTRYSNLLYPGIAPNLLDEVEGIATTLFGFKVGPKDNKTDVKREYGFYDYDDYVESQISDAHFKLKKRGQIP